jgi:hypothetical protein
LPSLRVIAALLHINPDDPADSDDLKAAAMLLARPPGEAVLLVAVSICHFRCCAHA